MRPVPAKSEATRKRRPDLNARMIYCQSARAILAQLPNEHSWVARKKIALEEFFGIDPINAWVAQERQKLFDALKKYPGKHYNEAGAKLEALFLEFERDIQAVLPHLKQIPKKTELDFSSEQIQTDLAAARIDPYYARKLGSETEDSFEIPTQDAEQRFDVKIFLSENKIVIQGKRAHEAMQWLERITEPEPAPGMTIVGTIIKITDFGFFVDFGPRRDGLVHNSEITLGSKNPRPLQEGETIQAEILEINRSGHIRLGNALRLDTNLNL